MALLASLSLIAAATTHPSPAGEAALARAIGDRVALAPVACIDPTDTTAVQIVEGTAIVYAANGRLYVNRPLTGAESLHRDDTLVTRINGVQLCRLNAITLTDAVSRIPHGFVVLGDFVPYQRPRRR